MAAASEDRDARLWEEAADEIERLRRNLNGRDDFLGKIDQWQAFVDQLPQK